MTNRRFAALLFTVLLAVAPLHAEAPITIVVVDLPNEGFNDSTPAEPVGGNTGVTVGEQRLIAFRYAAAIWSSKLDSPVPIRVARQLQPPGALRREVGDPGGNGHTALVRQQDSAS